MRVLFSSITYGPVDPQCVSAIRYAIMVAANDGIQWHADLSPDRMTYSTGRNMVAEWVYDNPGKVDGVMWVDSDIVPAADSIRGLLGTVVKFGFPVLSGVYHQRREPHRPVFYRYNPKSEKYDTAHTYEPNTIYGDNERMACGFGFVWTSEAVIRAVRNSKKFVDVSGGRWFPDLREGCGRFGEDIGFCHQAYEAGFRTYIDTGIQVGHMGDGAISTRETYLQHLAGPKGVTVVEAC